jgi:hypothetical protein
MRTIWKYEITAMEPIKVFEMPSHATIIHVDSQELGTLQFWAEVDMTEVETDSVRNRQFRVYGTGHPIDHADEYIGTALDHSLVWHLYEQRI